MTVSLAILGMIYVMVSCAGANPLLHLTESEDNCETGYSSGNDPIVFLTVSSLASEHITERLLELNWYNMPWNCEEARVVLYTHEPQQNITDFVVSIDPRYHSNHHYRTSVTFPKYVFNSNNLTNECLGFWIALVVEDRILASSCIRAQPHWMDDTRSVIGNSTLMELMLPGTHNAGSYASFNPSQDNIFNRYLVTQDESVWNQLVYGIRYLDLRVSYEVVNGRDEVFWITHGVFRTEVSVTSVIAQVKKFLNATNEIVIMDFHRFVNGFKGRRNQARHRMLVDLLQSELSEYMIPVSMSSWATLNELWQANKRLYVGYAYNTERSHRTFLFPAVRHLWGDKDRMDDLYEFLNRTVCSQQRRITSAMCQLTPTTTGAVFDVYGGLRKMADEVNRHATTWFRELWWQCANIVSTDFFLGPRVSLTVRSKVPGSVFQKRTDRQLDINWFGLDCSLLSSYTLELYSRDPLAKGAKKPVFRMKPTDCPDSYHETNFRLPRYELNEWDLTEKCIGYWIALKLKKTVLHSSCIKLRPNWMYNMRHTIGNASLLCLMIPGTHDSATYTIFNPLRDTVVHRYVYTQEETVYDQLAYGIRYLDLRVWHENNPFGKSKLQMTHGMYRINLPYLGDILHQVKKFVSRTNEIVILDFHRLLTGVESNLSLRQHKDVISLVEKELGKYLVPGNVSPGTKLYKLWEHNYRVYVSYASPVSLSKSVHPKIRHLWANTDKVYDLFRYLDRMVCRYENELTSAMVHLTPMTTGAIFDLYGGLRTMANTINHNITSWFLYRWQCANIVSSDFFLGNNVIDLAIKRNQETNFCHGTDL